MHRFTLVIALGALFAACGVETLDVQDEAQAQQNDALRVTRCRDFATEALCESNPRCRWVPILAPCAQDAGSCDLGACTERASTTSAP